MRRLGRSAIHLPAFGLGGAPLGNLFAPVPEAEAEALLQAAWAGGVRYFDTAPHYGQGLSEQRFGRFMAGLPRDEFVLSTKVGRIMTPDPDAPSELNSYVGALQQRSHYDYSRDGTLRSLEDSLKRLSLSRVDIVFIHDIDTFTHGPDQPRRFREAMSGAWPALAELRAQGVIGAVGLGVNDWQVCRDALREADFDGFLLAGRYTLLDQSALHELLPLCLERQASIVIGGPYNSGVLAPLQAGDEVTSAGPPTYDYRPASPQVLARVRRLREVAAGFDIELAAAALQFALAHPAVVSVIPGARRVAEVQANLALAQATVPAAFWQALKDQGLIEPHAPTPTPAG